MKKVITALGIIILFMLSIGTIFKVMQWPGANTALILGVGLLFFFLLLLMIVSLSAESSSLAKASQGVGFLGGWIYSTAILFKIMHWPGANTLLLFGMLLLFFIFLPMYLTGMRQNKVEGRLTTHTIMLLAIFGMLMIAYAGKKPTYNLMQEFCKINNKTLQSIHFTDQPKENIYSLFDEKLHSAPDSFHVYFDKALTLKHRSQEMRDYIEHIKSELISETEGIDANDSTDLSSVISLDNNVIPTHYMLGEGLGSNSGKGYELREKIKNYKADLSSYIHADSHIHLGLDVGEQYDDHMGENYTWPEYYFYHTTLAGTITTLTELEAEVETSEITVLVEILKESQSKNAQSQSK